jgi:hypothetical protein
MSVLLKVKNQTSFDEITVNIPGNKTPLVIGVKLYSNSELTNLRLQYKDVLQNDEQDKFQAKLNDLRDTGDRTSDDFYTEQAVYERLVTDAALEKDASIINFYKKQITHLKNASLQYEDEAGKIVDLIVADTRVAPVVESLWSDSEDCLVVLLDLFFEYPGLGDSLITNIGNAVFQSNINDKQKAKVKN